MCTFDPGFTSTASCESAITFIDGNKGILLYRGCAAAAGVVGRWVGLKQKAAAGSGDSSASSGGGSVEYRLKAALLPEASASAVALWRAQQQRSNTPAPFGSTSAGEWPTLLHFAHRVERGRRFRRAGRLSPVAPALRRPADTPLRRWRARATSWTQPSCCCTASCPAGSVGWLGGGRGRAFLSPPCCLPAIPWASAAGAQAASSFPLSPPAACRRPSARLSLCTLFDALPCVTSSSRPPAPARCPPPQGEKAAFEREIKLHTLVHEQLIQFYRGFRHDAHPMAIMCGVVGALAAFYPEVRAGRAGRPGAGPFPLGSSPPLHAL